MTRNGEQGPSVTTDVRRWVGRWVTGLAAAAVAIVLALIATTGVVLALGAIGVGGIDPAPRGVVSALEDAALAFYLAQLVGLWFFDHTAELRFVAIPLLLLIGSSVAAATAVGARLTSGSARRRCGSHQSWRSPTRRSSVSPLNLSLSTSRRTVSGRALP